jgi:transposase
MNKRRGPSAYTDEFRQEAVRLVEAGVRPLSEIAKELGMHADTLRSWCQLTAKRRAGAPASMKILLEEENRRLRQENARLREEREILKKATAFFAKDAP